MSNLDQYNDSWDEAEVRRFGNVPPGTYQASVEEARVAQPEWMDDPQLSLKCKVMNGEWQGKTFFAQWRFSQDRKKMGFVRSAVAAMEMDPPIKSAGEIGDRCGDMLDRVLTIAVKHVDNPHNPEKPYVNCYVQGYVGMKNDLMAEMGEGELDKLGF